MRTKFKLTSSLYLARFILWRSCFEQLVGIWFPFVDSIIIALLVDALLLAFLNFKTVNLQTFPANTATMVLVSREVVHWTRVSTVYEKLSSVSKTRSSIYAIKDAELEDIFGFKICFDFFGDFQCFWSKSLLYTRRRRALGRDWELW